MKSKKSKTCHSYCGITCVNGYCPNALSNYDAERDDDAYACYHLDKKLSCKDCGYNKGCEDCCFVGTDMCSHEIDDLGGN